MPRGPSARCRSGVSGLGTTARTKRRPEIRSAAEAASRPRGEAMGRNQSDVLHRTCRLRRIPVADAFHPGRRRAAHRGLRLDQQGRRGRRHLSRDQPGGQRLRLSALRPGEPLAEPADDRVRRRGHHRPEERHRHQPALPHHRRLRRAVARHHDQAEHLQRRLHRRRHARRDPEEPALPGAVRGRGRPASTTRC